MGAGTEPVAARREDRSAHGVGSPRAAVAFLTRIPAGGGGTPLAGDALGRASLWFPAVGALVGAVMGGAYLLCELAGLPPGPSTVVALTVSVLVTGGLHEDGLADVADAAGAHVSRDRRLEILRDSRVGTFGALAVVLPLLLAYSALSTVDGDDVLKAAVVAHVLARCTILALSRLPSARPGGSGSLVRAPALVLVAATAYTAAVVLIVGGLTAGAIALGVAAALTAIGGAGAQRLFGGVTGDVFGAVTKVVEVTTYVVLVSVWG